MTSARVFGPPSAMAGSQKRSCNWTEREKMILVEEVVKRETIIFGKFNGSQVTGDTKQKAWEAVTASVNAIAQVPKTTDQVKKQYSNIKQRAKETVDSMRKTGGGPKQEPSASQTLLLENIGSRPEVIGLPLNLDTEDSNFQCSVDSEETCVLLPVSELPEQSNLQKVSQNDKERGMKRKRDVDVYRNLETTNIKLENDRIKEETKKIQLELEKLKIETEVLKLKKNYYTLKINQLCDPASAYLYEV